MDSRRVQFESLVQAYVPDLYRYAIWLGNGPETAEDLVQGILVPAGAGSMAIVGEPGEALEAVEERLRQSVRFAPQRRAGGELRPGGAARDRGRTALPPRVQGGEAMIRALEAAR